jgi:hypothetical protein
MPASPALVELEAIAANYIADLLGATPAAPLVKLVAAPFTPSPTLDPTTLTYATFDGYANKSVTSWGTVHIDGSNQATWISTSALDWTPTGSTTTNTIYGYVLLDSNGVLVQSETFATPVLMHGVLTTLQLVIQLAIGPWQATAVLLP